MTPLLIDIRHSTICSRECYFYEADALYSVEYVPGILSLKFCPPEDTVDVDLSSFKHLSARRSKRDINWKPRRISPTAPEAVHLLALSSEGGAHACEETIKNGNCKACYEYNEKQLSLLR
jgi:hypothetical protein